METICYMSDIVWSLNGLICGIIVFGLGVSFIYHLITAKGKKNG